MKLRRISIIVVLSLVLVAVSHGKNLKGTTIDQTEPVSIVATSSSCGCCHIVQPVTTCGCGCTPPSPPPPPPPPPPPEPAPVQPKTLPLAPAEKEAVQKAEAENVRILKEREAVAEVKEREAVAEVPPAPMKKKEGPIVDKLPDPEESSEKSYEAMPATAKAKLGPNALTSIKRQGKQKGNIKNATETTNKYDSS